MPEPGFRENFKHANIWTVASQGFEPDWPLPIHTLYAGIMGSQSHGTYTPPSNPDSIDDIDLMVIVQPPRQFTYGLVEWEHWCPRPGNLGELDVVTYSVRKFTRLLLKGNPNVVGLLWLPESGMVFRHGIWDEWIKRRDAFLSMRVFDSFVHYALAQLSKLGHPNTRGYMGAERKRLFETHGYDCKNAAHCLRLLRMGLELMETGELHVDRTGIDAEELIEVKSGRWPLSKVELAAQRGFVRMEEAATKTKLPALPDAARAERLMMLTTEALW